MSNNNYTNNEIDYDKKFRVAYEDRWKSQFCYQYGVERIDGRGGCARLLDDEKYLGKTLHPPGMDHWALWGKDGQALIYTFEPYGMCMDCFKDLIAFCDEHGLTFKLGMRSFYAPGLSSLFILWDPKKKRIR